MGKASRKRGSDGAIITTRSAWVAVYRELMHAEGRRQAIKGPEDKPLVPKLRVVA